MPYSYHRFLYQAPWLGCTRTGPTGTLAFRSTPGYRSRKQAGQIGPLEPSAHRRLPSTDKQSTSVNHVQTEKSCGSNTSLCLMLHNASGRAMSEDTCTWDSSSTIDSPKKPHTGAFQAVSPLVHAYNLRLSESVSVSGCRGGQCDRVVEAAPGCGKLRNMRGQLPRFRLPKRAHCAAHP